jgi:hypothetical protein
MNQVVCNGDLMIEAREPNISGKEELVMAKQLGKMFACQANSGDIVVRGAPSWSANFWQGGVVWGAIGGNWGCMCATITSSQANGANHQVFLGTKNSTWWWNAGGSCFLTGVKGALNADKEFFLDEAADRLYLRAPGGANPSSMVVYVKNRTTVIDMTSRNYVVFDSVNSMMGLINMKGATNCALRNGRHLYSSHFYLFKSAGGEDIIGNGQNDPLVAGVYVSGENNSIEGCEIAYAATGVRLAGRNHVVRNCVITDIYGGTYFSNLYIAPFEPWSGESGGHLIERCTIARACRSCIHLASSGSSIYKKCRILHNDLSQSMLLCEDGGTIYSFHVDGGGTEIAYNWVHDLTPLKSGIWWGIYFDNNDANFLVHHDVLWNNYDNILQNANTGPSKFYNITMVNNYSSTTNPWTTRNFYVNPYDLAQNCLFTSGNVGGSGNTNMASSGFVGAGAGGLKYRPTATCAAVNRGVVVPGITDGYAGSAPDAGAYEYGGSDAVSNWTAGAWSADGQTPTDAMERNVQRRSIGVNLSGNRFVLPVNSGKARVEILRGDGRRMIQTVTADGSKGDVVIPSDRLPAGMCVVRILWQGGEIVRRLPVVR